MDEPIIYRFPVRGSSQADPVVISGIGLATSIGDSREAVWRAIQTGQSGIRRTTASDGVGQLRLPCGMVDWLKPSRHRLKSVTLSELVADEALRDAGIDWQKVDRQRFATSISTQFGDIGYLYQDPQLRDQFPAAAGQPQWWNEFMPCSASAIVANQFGLYGPRLCHATACASGLISTIVAARMIEDGAADFALCGAADMVHELMLASFHRMGVLADAEDASTACKPFDKDRNGFVMGEGAAMLVLERRSQAESRGATIYAELAGSASSCLAAHVTGLDGAAESLTHLIKQLTKKTRWEYLGPDYINAHGTGTTQNDISELVAIRGGLGQLADRVVVSSNKAVLGHLINAAGSVELAITAMALRDGYAPPTMNLAHQETQGDIDCLPGSGSKSTIDRAYKLSLAFGGHLVGLALCKSDQTELQRPSQPLVQGALVRSSDSQFRLGKVA
jgi:3-oxoacyl-(acyl-carrier-protein) synthase